MSNLDNSNSADCTDGDCNGLVSRLLQPGRCMRQSQRHAFSQNGNLHQILKKVALLIGYKC